MKINILNQINDAASKIRKIRHTKKFQHKVDKMFFESQKEFSERNLTSQKGKFCLAVQVGKYHSEPFLSEIFLTHEEIKNGSFCSFEQPSEQLYYYGEVIKIF